MTISPAAAEAEQSIDEIVRQFTGHTGSLPDLGQLLQALLDRELAAAHSERDKAQQDCKSYECTIDLLTAELDAARLESAIAAISPKGEAP